MSSRPRIQSYRLKGNVNVSKYALEDYLDEDGIMEPCDCGAFHDIEESIKKVIKNLEENEKIKN